MQDLKKLDDTQLLQKTREIAKKEMHYSRTLVHHLQEVDDRKLFATLGYDTLGKYVIKDLGYDEATAYSRIRVMRLARKIPEIHEKIETGKLSLTTAAKLECFQRQEKWSPHETLQLVEEIGEKSARDVEILLLSKTENPVPKEKVRQITPNLKEAKLILTAELQSLLERYEELHGKSSIADILGKVLAEHLKKHDPMNKTVRTSSLFVNQKPQAQRRTPTARVRHELWMRSQSQCEWKHPETGKRCDSRFRLEMDHFPLPFAKGGESTIENMRLVCRAHNFRFGVEVFGVEKMNAFAS